MSWSTVQLSSRLLFCAQKLRPTWQLEDSSVYNIDVCPTTPTERPVETWVTGGSAKELILWLNGHEKSATAKVADRSSLVGQMVGGIKARQLWLTADLGWVKT